MYNLRERTRWISIAVAGLALISFAAMLRVLAVPLPGEEASTQQLPESIEALYRLDIDHCARDRVDVATLCRAAAAWRRQDAYADAARRSGCRRHDLASTPPDVCVRLVAAAR